jgi:hypothetical protein
MTNDRVYLSGNGWATEITPNDCVVVYAPQSYGLADALNDPADNRHLSVADAYEQLTFKEGNDEDLPSFELVESLGFDGTGRCEPLGHVTWRQVAERLLEQREKETDLPGIDDIVAAGMPGPEDGEFIEWKDIAAHLQGRFDQAKQMARELRHDTHTLDEFMKGNI